MRDGARGLGLVEILVVLVIVAVAGLLLHQYMGTTARTVEQLQAERPLGQGRVAADQATLGALRSTLALYRAQHERWPADKAAVLALLPGPPRFQCPGNDFAYDPASGEVRLLIVDPVRC